MAYTGQIEAIPVGEAGLHTDDPSTKTPLGTLRVAENITLVNGVLEKAPGSMQWNATAQLPAGVKQFSEWFPNQSQQRIVTVNRDGKVYRFENMNNFTEVTTSVVAQQLLNVDNFVTIAQAGSEETAKPKKLFILTGNNPIQVITGDVTARTNISNPAADWTGSNQPFGIMEFLNRKIAWGNPNSPHRLYISLATDHEDFLTAPASIEVFPSEGEGIRDVFTWKKRLWVIKFPNGVYTIDIPTLDPATWFPLKEFDTFGEVSPHASVGVMNDRLIGNEIGSLTSLALVEFQDNASNTDLFHVLKTQKFFRNSVSKAGFEERHAVYYRDKKQAMFTYRSSDSDVQNTIVVLDYHDMQRPQVYILTKDQPNCLQLFTDTNKIQKPMYGSDDGFLYLMDSPNRWVGNTTGVETAYEMVALLPPVSFGHLDEKLGDSNKAFDFLQIVYLPTGETQELEVDIFIDEKFSETVKFLLSGTTDLDVSQLDAMRFTEEIPQSTPRKIHGYGRRISLKARHSGLNNVKIVKYKVWFRPSDQRQKGVGR